MSIEELIKLCDEYQRNTINKSLLEASINSNNKYSHLKWAVDRDIKSLDLLCGRQVEIQDILTDMNEITF